MDAPIGHGAAGIVPEIAEGGEAGGFHAPAVGVEGHFGAGPSHISQFEIVGRGAVGEDCRSRSFLVAPLWKVWQKVMSPMDPPGHQFGSLLEIAAGALHGAGLHHALVFARGLHHLLALFDVGAGGLFHLDIFACLAGFDGHVGVPVVGRGDADGVDGLVGQDVAEIFDGLGLERPSWRRGDGAFQVRL